MKQTRDKGQGTRDKGQGTRDFFYFLLFTFALFLSGCSKAKPRVVLYCAQDQEFAESVLGDFTAQTDIAVAPRYDTEANKTIALFEDLRREKDRPRCDVYWNNEILATIRLQRLGLLEPYFSPSAKPYPEHTRPKDQSWQQFAARARVFIINTNRVSKDDYPRSYLELTSPRWKGKAAMAKPNFGTTATHAACLFEVLGKDQAQEFYCGLKANGINIVAGNKQVARGVAEGKFDLGITDTDDAIIEVEAGKPVAIIFPDRDGHKDYPRLGTLFIPNTIAVIKGCPNPEGARKLVDYLLSPEVETKLAQSASRQIPLNPEVKVRPHDRIETPATVKRMEVDFDKAVDLWEEVQAFLRKEML